MTRSWPRAAFMRRSGHTSPAASSPAKEPRPLKPRHNRSRIEDRGSRIEDRGSRIEDRGSNAITHRDPLSSIFYLLSSILDPLSSILYPGVLAVGNYRGSCLLRMIVS